MKHLTALIALLCCHVSATAADIADSYRLLAQTMEKHDTYTTQRVKHLNDLRTAARFAQGEPTTLLKIYDEAFNGYYAFQYDSAMAYVKRGLALAQAANNDYYLVKNRIHRALLLASIGFYQDSSECMDSVPIAHVPEPLLFKYYFTQYKIYSFWDNYYGNSEFKNKLKNHISHYLSYAIRHAPKEPLLRAYLQGEYHSARQEHKTAMLYFRKVVTAAPQTNPLYASAAYNLANCYQAQGDMNMYERHLILAAMGDIKCSTKENVALQDLATFIFNNRKERIELAERYINFSMKDAQFYNSRLRMISISQKMPVIVSTYQEKLSSQNGFLWMGISIISLLLLSVVAMLFYIIRQKNLLASNRKEISDSYITLKELNEKVNATNRQLLDINTRREVLAKVYIDLCAKYIERLHNYQLLVKRKIKANQVRDLLSQMTSSRLSNEEAARFLSQFDRAFLNLYPTFIEGINSLLKPDCAIIPKTEKSMTMELRVLALIRLGVKDSAEIADLLFYSPQTVYNYRWSLKCKALNKDTFEHEVTQLCKFG